MKALAVCKMFAKLNDESKKKYNSNNNK